MENNEIKEMLLDLKKGQEKLFEGQSDLFKGQEKLFEDQEERDKILFDLKKGQEKLFEGQSDLFKGQEKLFKEIDKLNLTVARIEAEHGEKLDILLDVVTGHTDQLTSVNKRVEKCEKRLDNHDDKIYVLNSVVHAY